MGGVGWETIPPIYFKYKAEFSETGNNIRYTFFTFGSVKKRVGGYRVSLKQQEKNFF